MGRAHIWTCVGFETLTVSNVAVGPTAAVSTDLGASRALVGPTPNALRWRADGGNPTAAVGHPLPDGITQATGCQADVEGDLSKLKLIRALADSDVPISYWKIS